MVRREYGKALVPTVDPEKHYEAIIACVAHNEFKSFPFARYKEQGAVIFDVKNFVDRGLVDGRL